MNKETKKNYIDEMKKVFSSNDAVMIAHYQGLNVIQLDALRKELRENGIIFKITKNRITKLAVKETPLKELEKFFTGPTAAAISSDPFMSARILSKFAKTNDKLKIVAGFMEGKVIDQAEVAKIASLPTLKEARANIVGVLNASAQKLIGILLAQSKKMASLAPAEENKK
ncbi:MAG: 50S ribosomal protein L10 [Pelagibacteraceae bacterium]|jgi:large subunit ribosomal protein L10|nr:50S ribosomal protein L10 [Pelagibacteraceae bacterium]